MWRWMAISEALLLSACGLLYPSDKLRHRITVNVDTPAGIREGSSVIETRVEEGKSWGDASGTRFRLKGEAVAVDLPGGRTLYALLRPADSGLGDASGYQTRLLWEALRGRGSSSAGGNTSAMDVMEARAAAKEAKVKLELPAHLYPLLVTFRDPADPASITRVEPSQLAAHFGAGVRLRGMAVEVTDAAVTEGLESRLPDRFWRRWAATHKAQMSLNGGIMRNPFFQSLAGNLSRNDFREGEKGP
ncbi:hypothetical protein GCM10022280_22210 [Sphingomonas swuensis]|uniref:Lipoprotein n=1 Tax=Sphingomonas swuensis TaxID=977800 RepID=A0ABP7T531_9SPHN